MSNLIDKPTFSYSYAYEPNIEITSYLHNYADDCISLSSSFVIDANPLDILKAVKKEFDRTATVKSFRSNELILMGKQFLMQLTFNESWNNNEKKFASISIFGNPDVTIKMQDFLQRFRMSVATVSFYYRTSSGSIDSFETTLHTDITHHDEFYPWIPSNYFDEYFANAAPILFMFGAPGTGKTSVIRNAIIKNEKHAILIHEEDILKQESIFIRFLTDSSINMMVVEDCDEMLHSRKRGKNDIIVKILNYSEGILRFPNKKIIFTTNMDDFANIDTALTRPGRCYGSLVARAMNHEEACAASKVAKIDAPAKVRDYTIAELLATGYNNSIKPVKMGFGTGAVVSASATASVAKVMPSKGKKL
jgi:hypothetical protein